MAPTLVAWVLWIMRRSVETGCKRIYFVSRDGQILLDVAQRLEPQIRTGLELRYIYGSRHAWFLAGSESETDVRLMLDLHEDFLSVRAAIEGAGLVPEQAVELLPRHLQMPAQWDKNLTARERAAVFNNIVSARGRELAAAAQLVRKAALIDYLGQEGFADGVPFALVDVGWRGRMARALASAIQGSQLALPKRLLYFGLTAEAQKLHNVARLTKSEAWFFGCAPGQARVQPPPSLSALIEAFCVADHGPVTGYEWRDGVATPVTKPDPADVVGWGLPLVRATTAAFVDSLHLNEHSVDPWVDLRGAIRDVLNLFWLSPSQQEVAAWGAFPITVDQAHTALGTLAEPVRLAYVIESLRSGRPKLRRRPTWPMGTALVSGTPYRILLKSSWWLRRGWQRLKH